MTTGFLLLDIFFIFFYWKRSSREVSGEQDGLCDGMFLRWGIME